MYSVASSARSSRGRRTERPRDSALGLCRDRRVYRNLHGCGSAVHEVHEGNDQESLFTGSLPGWSRDDQRPGGNDPGVPR